MIQGPETQDAPVSLKTFSSVNVDSGTPSPKHPRLGSSPVERKATTRTRKSSSIHLGSAGGGSSPCTTITVSLCTGSSLVRSIPSFPNHRTSSPALLDTRLNRLSTLAIRRRPAPRCSSSTPLVGGRACDSGGGGVGRAKSMMRARSSSGRESKGLVRVLGLSVS